MTLVQVNAAATPAEAEGDEHHCVCCLNRIRVAALKRKRHASWMARGAKRQVSART